MTDGEVALIFGLLMCGSLCFACLIIIVAGTAAKVAAYREMNAIAKDGNVYCKIAGEGDNAIYGWLTPEEYTRIVMTDRSE